MARVDVVADEPTAEVTPFPQSELLQARQPERPEVASPPTPRGPSPVIFPARQIMTALEFGLRVLSLRLLLFVAFLAAAGLGYLMVADPQPARIWALGVWSVLVFAPIVALNARRP